MIAALSQIAGFVLATSFAGFNIIIACDREGSLSEMEAAGLSYLFGIGAIAIEIFLFGLLRMKFMTAHILLPWVLLAVINVPRFKARFGKKSSIVPAQPGRAGLPVRRSLGEGGNLPYYGIVIKVAAALLIFVVSYAFFMALVRPIESYDAVTLWSLKAKILYLAGTIPPDFFSMMETGFHGAHPDYPLLLPLSEVWFYTSMNNFNDHLVKALFPLNFLAFLAVFYAFLKRATSDRALSLLFTFILASVRQFSNYATNGYADMQMAIYASLTFLALYLWISEKRGVYLWTAFFSCIFAMWTKNEGAVVLLGFAVIVTIRAFTQAPTGKRSLSSYRTAVYMTAILIILFISWSFFKNAVNVRNDVVNAQVFAKCGLLSIFKRASAILYEYQRQAFGIKYWNLAWIVFISLAALRSGKLFSEEYRFITIPIFLILSCYTAVYFITPHDILWQLRTTTSRLLIHILPLAVFYIAVETKNIFFKSRE